MNNDMEDATSATAAGNLSMRKQYYFRHSKGGLLAWDVDRLIMRSRHFHRVNISVSAIRELDLSFASEFDHAPTWQDVVNHVELIEAADLRYPIILSADGGVMDGMHRVAKAVLLGEGTIEAVQFNVDPEPDYVGVSPDKLPYNEPTFSCPEIKPVTLRLPLWL
jgi:hypothetical protein